MKNSTILMFVCFLLFIMFGYLDRLFLFNPNTQNYFVISLLTQALAIFAWFLADAKDIGHKPSSGLKIAVVAFAFMAIPYYLFRYKGWRRTLVSFSKFFVFIIVYVIFEFSLDYLLA